MDFNQGRGTLGKRRGRIVDNYILSLPKAIETGMILLNMDMKNQLLCVFFIDLYSPR